MASPVSPSPSALAVAAIRLAQHVVEARRARQAAEEAERRVRMTVVDGGKRKGEAA